MVERNQYGAVVQANSAVCTFNPDRMSATDWQTAESTDKWMEDKI